MMAPTSLTLMLQAAPAQPGSMSPLIVMGFIFLMFYLLILRPRGKEQKARQAMIDGVKNGDRVETIGGLVGTIAGIKDTTVTIKVSETKLELKKSAINAVLTDSQKG